jgi:hypothetical protein
MKLKLDIEAKMDSQKWFKSESGYIASPQECDILVLIYYQIIINEDDAFKIALREKEVNKWNIICKDKPSLLQFLKDNIHKNA